MQVGGQAGDSRPWEVRVARSTYTFQALLGVRGELPVPELVMQEPDDGVGQTLLVIHLEMGADKVWGFRICRQRSTV